MKNLKENLRKESKAIRRKLNTEIISEQITKNVKEWNIYQNAKTVMLFHPLNDEINLLSLTCDNKNFVFPKINNEKIIAVQPQNNLFQIGKYNIKEPLGNTIAPTQIDLVFLPALACDKSGNRLGYGKGYYDKFIKKLDKNVIKVIPIYEDLFHEEIPNEQHDQKADFVITEKQIWKINKTKT